MFVFVRPDRVENQSLSRATVAFPRFFFFSFRLVVAKRARAYNIKGTISIRYNSRSTLCEYFNTAETRRNDTVSSRVGDVVLSRIGRGGVGGGGVRDSKTRVIEQVVCRDGPRSVQQ